MRRHTTALPIATGAALSVGLLHTVGLLDRLELIALDARYASGLGGKAPRPDVTIAWIDQESMDYLADNGVPFPWPRSVYAEVLDHLRAPVRARWCSTCCSISRATPRTTVCSRCRWRRRRVRCWPSSSWHRARAVARPRAHAPPKPGSTT